jgi:hypothetical protein
LAIAFVLARVLVQPLGMHSVYGVYAGAARNWLSGSQIYDWREAAGFRYAPAVAILFLPLAALPDRPGEVLWRLANVAIYFAALYWCWSLRIPTRAARKYWAIMLLLVLPLSLGSINSGQANCLLIGLLLIAIASIHTERWNLAAVALTLACFLKLYPIALAMLLALLFPRKFTHRFIVCCAIGLALPFLFQRPTTAVQQYADWFLRLHAEDRHDRPAFIWYSDVRLLLKLCHISTGPLVYVAIQLIAALLIALLCHAGQIRRWPNRLLLGRTLALACCWMTVLGPSTENNTYILIAPSLVWALCDAWFDPSRRVERAFLITSYALLICSVVALWFPFGRSLNAYGFAPLGGLLFFGLLFARSVMEVVDDEAQAPKLVATKL